MGIIQTTQAVLTTALKTSSTAAAFAAVPPATTVPPDTDTDGIHKLPELTNLLCIIPIGTDAANEVFDFRLYAWHQTTADDDTVLFIPRLVVEATATLSTYQAGSYFLADTIVVGTNSDNITVDTNADNAPSRLTVDMLGASFLQFDFDLITAATANVYFWGV